MGRAVHYQIRNRKRSLAQVPAVAGVGIFTSPEVRRGGTELIPSRIFSLTVRFFRFYDSLSPGGQRSPGDKESKFFTSGLGVPIAPDTPRIPARGHARTGHVVPAAEADVIRWRCAVATGRPAKRRARPRKPAARLAFSNQRSTSKFDSLLFPAASSREFGPIAQ